MSDNRKFPRMTVDHEITWKPAGDEGEQQRVGIARNISGNGVLFAATECPQIGERMELTLNTGVLSIPALSVLVEVVRVTESAPAAGYYEVGARIMAMK